MVNRQLVPAGGGTGLWLKRGVQQLVNMREQEHLNPPAVAPEPGEGYSQMIRWLRTGLSEET
jgi:hypothetical protein